ncbi:hypothetical protein C8Q80DRAFT_1232487 [Daedaleopsis nitida]|nr:hypothetical protein C8Q80DRAFT_1232487 [Daedaleopsis nitida]
MPYIGTMTVDTRKLTFVYYCSGHGYGHATRVSAFTRHLLGLERPPAVHIVSSAPKHVFADSIAVGALYRNANIDPVIVQPLAYRVDRQKSVHVLESFLANEDDKVWDEAQWLKSIRADCVLSDAAFLGCLVAHHAGIPSVLITNFSFDSVYSYLSTPLIDEPPKPEHPAVDGMLSPPSAKAKEELEPDVPIPLEVLTPLVKHIHDGYRCADLLLRLPGAIPLPSFAMHPSLPSPNWVDIEARCFKSFVTDHLTQPPSTYKLLPQLPFPDQYPPKPLAREARSAPLLVRSPDPAIYTAEGLSRLLDSIGVPPDLHDPATTKILIVSFGGQVFHKPHSRSHSRTPSKAATPAAIPPALGASPANSTHPAYGLPPSASMDFADPKRHARALNDALQTVSISRLPDSSQQEAIPPAPLRSIPSHLASLGKQVSRSRALSQLRLAGAPPAAVPKSPRTGHPATFSAPATIPTFQAPNWTTDMTASPSAELPLDVATALKRETAEEIMDDADVRILPDETWIAVVCGVSKDWGKEDGEELPHNFFVAPRDVYMPDLTAAADVLLGKLGYGTVSECVDSCTPFVYVPRPLFIEEHGLRLYLEREGVGVELSRTQYEVGEWADAIEVAWQRGREAKARKRQEGETGRRKEEGREMAQYVVDWVWRWKDRMHPCDSSKTEDIASINGVRGGGEWMALNTLPPT